MLQTADRQSYQYQYKSTFTLHYIISAMNCLERPVSNYLLWVNGDISGIVISIHSLMASCANVTQRKVTPNLAVLETLPNLCCYNLLDRK